MKVIFVQIFGNLRSRVNCTSDLNMVKLQVPKFLFWPNGHRKFDQFMIIKWKVLVQRHVQQSKVLARDLQKPAYTYNTILASTCKHLLC